MRAVRYLGPGKGVALARSAPTPVPPEGEALVRPLRVGVGQADLLAARGGPKGDGPAITLGHEFVGMVEKISPLKGQKERGPSLVGRRVVGSINAVCGECDLCRTGLSNHCRARTVLGVRGRDGCFADLFCLPAVNLHAVPAEIDDDHAVFAEPLAAAVQAAQQLHIEGKPYITVLGDGVVALLCAQLMTRLNASVRVLGVSERRLELAGKWGIKHRLMGDVGRRSDQDVVVDCTGTSAGLDLAMRLVRPRGKILLKGPRASESGEALVDLSAISENEIEVIGSRCGPIPEALNLLKRGEVDVVSLIGKRSRLDHAVEALRAADQPDQLKVLMDV